jgi:hypothetical protein
MTSSDMTFTPIFIFHWVSCCWGGEGVQASSGKFFMPSYMKICLVYSIHACNGIRIRMDGRADTHSAIYENIDSVSYK